MKKLLCLSLSLVMSITMLAGCSKSSSQTNEAATATAKATSSSDNGSKSVTVYSPHPAETINAGVKEFQEKTGIKVDVVAAGTGELLKRVEAESGNALGDVLWGGGADSLSAYAKFFEKYTPKDIASIDPNYVDKDGYWIGESPLPMVILYNKKLVAEKDVPKGWADLTDAKWKGKIAYADPAKSGSSYTTMCTMITAFGKDDGKGWDFIKKFYANLEGKVLSSSSAVPKGVADGEYSLGLTLEKEAANYVKSGAAVGIVYPAEGTSSVPDGIAIIKGAKNMENAKIFVDFVLGKECQSMMAAQLNRRPVRTDVAPPQGLQELKNLKLVNYDFNWASSNKETNLAKWKDVVIGK